MRPCKCVTPYLFDVYPQNYYDRLFRLRKVKESIQRTLFWRPRLGLFASGAPLALSRPLSEFEQPQLPGAS